MKTIFTFFIILHSIVSYECGTKERPDTCTAMQFDTLEFDLNEVQAQEMIKDLQSANDVWFFKVDTVRISQPLSAKRSKLASN